MLEVLKSFDSIYPRGDLGVGLVMQVLSNCSWIVNGAFSRKLP